MTQNLIYFETPVYFEKEKAEKFHQFFCNKLSGCFNIKNKQKQ